MLLPNPWKWMARLMSDSFVKIYVGGESKTVKEKGSFDDDWQLMTALSDLILKRRFSWVHVHIFVSWSRKGLQEDNRKDTEFFLNKALRQRKVSSNEILKQAIDFSSCIFNAGILAAPVAGWASVEVCCAMHIICVRNSTCSMFCFKGFAFLHKKLINYL